MPCSARATPVSLGLAFRKLAQARPTNRDADASEPHLRIPAEYHCRPREQRETGNNGRVGTRNGSYRVDTMKKKQEEAERKKEKKRRSSEEERVEEKEGEERVHRLELLFESVSYVFPPVSLLLAAASLLSATLLDPRFSRSYPAAPLNSHVTLRATILHSMYTTIPNDSTRISVMMIHIYAHANVEKRWETQGRESLILMARREDAQGNDPIVVGRFTRLRART